MSFKHLIEGPSKNQSSDFTGTCSNLIELSISEESTCGVVIDVAIATWEGRGGGGGGGGRGERGEGGERERGRGRG